MREFFLSPRSKFSVRLHPSIRLLSTLVLHSWWQEVLESITAIIGRRRGTRVASSSQGRCRETNKRYVSASLIFSIPKRHISNGAWVLIRNGISFKLIGPFEKKMLPQRPHFYPVKWVLTWHACDPFKEGKKIAVKVLWDMNLQTAALKSKARRLHIWWD